MHEQPFISVVIPCRNEAAFIENCLLSIVKNDYPKEKMEILVVDGGSADGTREKIAAIQARYPFIQLLDNPKGVTPTALNIGIRRAKGDIIFRMDCHATYSTDYLSSCVSHLLTHNADNVGGLLATKPRYQTLIARSIAYILSHPFGVGNSPFRNSRATVQEVDTVAFGCYPKKVFSRIGLFNERLTRSQDIEFNVRIKRAGGKILIFPKTIATYYPPGRLGHFIRHTFSNGIWAIYPLKFTSELFRPRHYIPLAFVLWLGANLLLGIRIPIFFWLFIFTLILYLSCSMVASLAIAAREKDWRLLPVLPMLFLLFHITYGAGSLVGALKLLFPSSFKIVFLFFIFSLFVSTVYLTFLKNVGPIQHQTPGSDYIDFYRPVAQTIIQGEPFPFEELGIRYSIGYPLFLAIVFSLGKALRIDAATAVMLVNVLLTALSTALVFLIAKQVFSRKTAIIAAFLWGTYPFAIWFTKNPHTEVPFITFFFLSFFFYLRSIDTQKPAHEFLAGIFLGIASLMRAITVFLPLLLAISHALLGVKQKGGNRLSQSMLFLFAYSLVIGPWLFAIYVNTQKIVPLSSGGPSSIVAGYTQLLLPGEGGDQINVPPDVGSLIQEMEQQTLATGTLTDIVRFFADASVRQPITIGKLFLIKLTRAWYATSEMWWETAIGMVQLIYIIPALIGAYLAWNKREAKREMLVVLFTAIGYFWAMTTLAASLLRYMVPVMAFVLMFTAVTILKFISHFAKTTKATL